MHLKLLTDATVSFSPLSSLQQLLLRATMDDSIVEIKYDRTGTTPPIFIAGTFTDWHPVELEPQQKDADYIFSRRFSVKPGTYQYKFRLGHGDWWVCDEAKQTGS